MNRLLITLALVSISSVTFAATSPKNLVERPITLVDGELKIAGAIQYGEEVDGDKEWNLIPHVAYGITDNLTVSLGEVRYRFLERENNKSGLELTAGLGYAGKLEIEGADDAHGAEFDITGKYVFTPNTALAFGIGYVNWQDFDLDKVDWTDEENKDRSEMRYSASLLQNLAKDVTLVASYTYRDLRDFSQSSAKAASVGVNYAYSNNIDMGVFGRYSDFNPEKNGFANNGAMERSAGVYVSYRF